MRKRIGWILTLMLISLAPRAGAYTVPYELWMGAYVGDGKVGYLSLKIEQSEHDGVKGYRIANTLNNQIRLLGADLSQLVTSVVRTDEHYAPLVEDFSMTSGGKTTRVRAVFNKDTIECVISAGSGSSTKTIPIPEGANLVGDSMLALPDATPEVGEGYRMHYFNPITLTVDELEVLVERREKLRLGDREYDALVLKNETPMGGMTVWQEPTGEILQVEAMLGIRMVRESQEKAISGLEAGPAQDFAVLTSVKANREIASPRRLRRLDIVLSGISDETMAINDNRQRATLTGDGEFRFQVQASDFDASRSVKLPIRSVDSGQFTEYLSVTPYIDHDLTAISRQAKEIVAGETDAYAACRKIRQWINVSMKYDAGIGITRCASDVLKSKVGVCRDYAILFTALARSAGIPAKIAAGLLYTEGRFYYHAWAECYVGEWVPFDATLQTDFVDATHIKLAEGDATSMFGLTKVIGSLSADIRSSE